MHVFPVNPAQLSLQLRQIKRNYLKKQYFLLGVLVKKKINIYRVTE